MEKRRPERLVALGEFSLMLWTRNPVRSTTD
jgi:hypothetical protein